MRILNTCVCMASLFALTPTNATAQSAAVHPVIGSAPPREVLNSDILKLPIKERQAWIHGAISQMITVYSYENPQVAGCLSEWYFGAGNGKKLAIMAIDKYPSSSAPATLLSLSEKICIDD